MKPRGSAARAQMPTAATCSTVPHSTFRLQMPIQLFQSSFQLLSDSVFSPILGPSWPPKSAKNPPKSPKNQLRHHTRNPTRLGHRIFMHLAPHGTSKMVFPPWREAHFANVALLLLHPFFHQFWNPFSDGFRSIFHDISHPNGDEKFDDFSCCFCCVFSSILGPSWRHLAPFGRDFGRSEPGQN